MENMEKQVTQEIKRAVRAYMVIIKEILVCGYIKLSNDDRAHLKSIVDNEEDILKSVDKGERNAMFLRAIDIYRASINGSTDPSAVRLRLLREMQKAIACTQHIEPAILWADECKRQFYIRGVVGFIDDLTNVYRTEPIIIEVSVFDGNVTFPDGTKLPANKVNDQKFVPMLTKMLRNTAAFKALKALSYDGLEIVNFPALYYYTRWVNPQYGVCINKPRLVPVEEKI